ncbi:hypothetical protein BKA69DRAFT_1049149 [Paraphysoderma sedebokerense]|nr:hypothetical protein BKA69DRAFT_1049149 [Paraphysoderma sedebokerense]
MHSLSSLIELLVTTFGGVSVVVIVVLIEKYLGYRNYSNRKNHPISHSNGKGPLHSPPILPPTAYHPPPSDCSASSPVIYIRQTILPKLRPLIFNRRPLYHESNPLVVQNPIIHFHLATLVQRYQDRIVHLI